MTAPERIWIEDERPDGGACHVYNEPSEGVLKYGTPYILATPEALAASPEVQTLITARAEAAEAESNAWRKAFTEIMPPDFKDWHENSHIEWPMIAAGCLVGARQDAELAWKSEATLRAQVERLTRAIKAANSYLDKGLHERAFNVTRAALTEGAKA